MPVLAENSVSQDLQPRSVGILYTRALKGLYVTRTSCSRRLNAKRMPFCGTLYASNSE